LIPWTGDGRRLTERWASPVRGNGGKNPTDRGKSATEKSVLVEADGGPLAPVIAGANVRDCKLLNETIEAAVVTRPDPEAVEQRLCLDTGYDNPSGHAAVVKHRYVSHIRPGSDYRQDKHQPGRRKARWWVAERTLAWLSKCRGLMVRYDKHPENFPGLIQLACGLLWYRRLHSLKAC
jgi:transposase